jgi:hypothetical protein
MASRIELVPGLTEKKRLLVRVWDKNNVSLPGIVKVLIGDGSTLSQTVSKVNIIRKEIEFVNVPLTNRRERVKVELYLHNSRYPQGTDSKLIDLR